LRWIIQGGRGEPSDQPATGEEGSNGSAAREKDLFALRGAFYLNSFGKSPERLRNKEEAAQRLGEVECGGEKAVCLDKVAAYKGERTGREGCSIKKESGALLV